MSTYNNILTKDLCFWGVKNDGSLVELKTMWKRKHHVGYVKNHCEEYFHFPKFFAHRAWQVDPMVQRAGGYSVFFRCEDSDIPFMIELNQEDYDQLMKGR